VNKNPGNNVVALVPMRHQSVRVEGKNYRKLGDVPLFHHILRTLAACPGISKVVIDTDSDIIRQDVKEFFPQVMLLDRPEHLRADDVPMTEILRHDALQVPADLYLQTHSTNPFLRAETIERALECWREVRHVHDSLFAVTRLQARLWDSTARPVNHNPWLLLRTQDLPPLFLENSNFYIFPPELIRSSGRRIGDRPKMFEVPPLESIDIDDGNGFAFAEMVIRLKKSDGK
jgi:CMP-N-acetylneuraminic acid synthetase